MPVSSLIPCKMDAAGFLVLLIVVSCGRMSTQAPQDKSTAEEAASATSTNNKEDDIKSPQNCTTAKSLSGVCVDRQYCEYSTHAVDLTLFATKQYEKPCSDQEVCCPSGFRTPEVKSKWGQNTLDDDDDDDGF